MYRKESMPNRLEDLKKDVHKSGFNISMMINLFYKRSKLREKLPDSVLCEVCLEYIKRGKDIKKTFPYFVRVLTNKSQQYFANKTQEDAKSRKFGKMPENIKSIMKGIV